MLVPNKAIIGKKPRKDGKHVIYFQYCYSSTNRVLLNSEIAVPYDCWNKKRQQVSKSLPIENGNAEDLNTELLRMRKVVERLIELAGHQETINPGQFVKERFGPQLELKELDDPTTIVVKAKELSFFDLIDDYIEYKRKKVVSVAAIKCMRDRLFRYQEHTKDQITFSILDYNFYLGLVDYLTYGYEQRRRKDTIVGLKTGTIGKTIKNFRVFIKDQVRRKLIPPINIDDFKCIDEDCDAVYVSYEEVSRMYYLDLKGDVQLELHRDLFVLGCLTGLRFSDYSTLSFNDLRGNVLYKKTDKMDNWVAIPMRTEALEIFTRVFKDGTPIVSHVVFNRNIKEIAKRAGIIELITFSHKKGNKTIRETKPKYSWIASHTCRRSFCTNEYLAGVDINLIMKISGHRSVRDFFKYIRVDQEQAARKIHEIWKQRSNMSALPVPKSA